MRARDLIQHLSMQRGNLSTVIIGFRVKKKGWRLFTLRLRHTTLRQGDQAWVESSGWFLGVKIDQHDRSLRKGSSSEMAGMGHKM